MVNIGDYIADSVPANMFRRLDGKLQAFDDAECLAHSDHESFFRLNTNWGWGVRWYALHRVDGRFVFTIGHGMWVCRREVAPDVVPELLSRFFSRNEVTTEGKSLLEGVR
jgi:hypothetical protein